MMRIKNTRYYFVNENNFHAIWYLEIGQVTDNTEYHTNYDKLNEAGGTICIHK